MNENMNNNCVNIGEGEDINFLIIFDKKREIFPYVTRFLSILLKAATTSETDEKANFKERVD